MTSENCALYETCGAPLCPMQEDDNGVWYADEEICRARRFQGLPWLKKQKRIAKQGLTFDDGFFTIRMLNAMRSVSKNLKGANPDIHDSEKQWLKTRSGDPRPQKTKKILNLGKRKSGEISDMGKTPKITRAYKTTHKQPMGC